MTNCLTRLTEDEEKFERRRRDRQKEEEEKEEKKSLEDFKQQKKKGPYTEKESKSIGEEHQPSGRPISSLNWFGVFLLVVFVTFSVLDIFKMSSSE